MCKLALRISNVKIKKKSYLSFKYTPGIIKSVKSFIILSHFSPFFGALAGISGNKNPGFTSGETRICFL